MGLYASTTELVVLFEVVRDGAGRVVDFRLLDVNPAFVAITGYAREKVLGCLASTLYGAQPPHLLQIEEMLAEDAPKTFRTYLPKARRHLRITAFPTDRRGRFCVVGSDLTPILSREAELLRLNRVYSALSQVNKAIVRSGTREDLLRNVCEAFVEHGRFDFASAVVRAPHERWGRPLCAAGEPADFVAGLELALVNHRGQLPTELAMSEGRTLLCNDLKEDPLARGWGPYALGRGFHSAIIFPLRLKEGIRGAISLYSRESDFVSPRELSMLDTAAADLAHALETFNLEAARQDAVRDLRESEQRFRVLFERAPVAYLCLDASGLILNVNQAWLELCAGGGQDMRGHQLIDFLQPQSRRRFLEFFQALQPGGGAQTLELLMGGEGRGELTVLLSLNAEFNAKGVLRMAHCSLFDITQRKRMEEAVQASERRLTEAFEIANDGLWELQEQTGEGYFSRRFHTMLGVDPHTQPLSLESWRQRVHPQDKAQLEAAFDLFFRCGGEELTCEYRLGHADGRWLHILTRGRRLKAEPGGSGLRLVGTNTDISERRQAEEALRQMAGKYRSYIDASPLGIFTLDTEGALLELNPACETLFGRSRAELLQGTFAELIDPNSEASLQVMLRAVASSGRGECEVRSSRRKGAVLNLLLQAADLGGGQLLLFCQDFTGRRRAELALQARETLLESVLRTALDGLWIIDAQGRLLEVNETYCGTSGYTQKELLHLRISDIEAQETPSVLDGHLQRIKRMGSDRWETVHRRKDGSLVDVEISASYLSVDEGRYVLFIQNIGERKRMVETLSQQAALLDQARDIVLATDTSGTVHFCNRSAEHFFGRSASELRGQALFSLFAGTEPELSPEFYQAALQGGGWQGELRFGSRHLSGTVLESRWSLVFGGGGKPALMLIAATDITERLLLQTRSLRSQRLESIGALATGIAHDLNNIFLPITLAANMLRQNPQPEQRLSLHAMLDQSSQRGADIVRQLLTFGKGLDGRRIELQPRIILHEISRIVAETFPKDIQFELHIAEDLWSIQADPTQIHQVLVNLCVNARDALPKGGTLSLIAENVVFDEYYAAMNPDTEAGPYVVLQVSDTGVGIPADDIERIFDPFFSTKTPGQGTGLGLSTVHGIVKSHRGFVQVRSLAGEGSVFKVYLPAIPNVVEVVEESSFVELPRGQGETILIVDDEEAVRRSLCHLLETQGYRALSAGDGREALLGFELHQQAVSALVTDIMMPVMDGCDLIRAVRRLAPDLPILAMSGLPEKEELLAAPELRVRVFLAKPFVSDQFLAHLHAVLHPSGEPTQAGNR